MSSVISIEISACNATQTHQRQLRQRNRISAPRDLDQQQQHPIATGISNSAALGINRVTARAVASHVYQLIKQ